MLASLSSRGCFTCASRCYVPFAASAADGRVTLSARFGSLGGMNGVRQKLVGRSAGWWTVFGSTSDMETTESAHPRYPGSMIPSPQLSPSAIPSHLQASHCEVLRPLQDGRNCSPLWGASTTPITVSGVPSTQKQHDVVRRPCTSTVTGHMKVALPPYRGQHRTFVASFGRNVLHSVTAHDLECHARLGVIPFMQTKLFPLLMELIIPSTDLKLTVNQAPLGGRQGKRPTACVLKSRQPQLVGKATSKYSNPKSSTRSLHKNNLDDLKKCAQDLANKLGQKVSCMALSLVGRDLRVGQIQCEPGFEPKGELHGSGIDVRDREWSAKISEEVLKHNGETYFDTQVSTW